MVDRIELSPRLRAAIKAVDDAEREHVPGRDSSAVVEIPKLALADVVRDAVRLAQLPRPTPARVMPAKRRKHA